MLALFAAAVQAASIVLVRVNSEGLNVRSHPSVASDVVGYFARGESTVATLGSAGDWLIVRTRDGKVGYVDARFVDLVKVLAVDGAPVPARGAESAAGGACESQTGNRIDVVIRDTRLDCRKHALGKGVQACDAHFTVEAAAVCTAKFYRALECEAGFTHREQESSVDVPTSAKARTVMVIDAGSGRTDLAVPWKAPAGDAEVASVRFVSGACVLK